MVPEIFAFSCTDTARPDFEKNYLHFCLAVCYLEYGTLVSLRVGGPGDVRSSIQGEIAIALHVHGTRRIP